MPTQNTIPSCRALTHAWVALTACVPLVFSSFCQAQSAEDETIQLPEFTVRGNQDQGWRATTTLSGTRANMDLKTFPKTIQVLTSEFLQDLNNPSFADAMHFVSNAIPTANDAAAFGHNNFMVRGFIQIRQYRNGIGEVSQITTDLATIDRIEVTKGPSSLLAGSAPPGGVINYITKKPLSYKQYSASLAFGSWNQKRGVIDLSSPITASKNLSYRFIAVYEDRDGFIDFERYTKQVYAPSLTWRVAKNTVIDASLEYAYQDTIPGSNDSYNFTRTKLAGEIGLLPWSFTLYGPDTQVDRESTQVNVELQHKFTDNLSLRAMFAFQDNDKEDLRTVFTFTFLDAANTLLGNGLNRRDGTWDRDFRGFWAYQSDLIWRWATPRIKNTFMVGLEQQEFYRDQVRIDSRITGPFRVAAPDYFFGKVPDDFIFPLLNRSEDSREVRQAVNLLGQSSLWNEKLHLMGGMRMERSKKTRSDRPPETAVTRFDATTFNAGVSYEASKRMTAYATYSESYFPPASGVIFPATPADPEMGKGADAGIRTSWLDNKLSFNATVFHLQRFNVGRADLEHTGFVIQSGKEESRGIELESVAQFSKKLSVFVMYGYLRGKVVSFYSSPALEGTELLGVPRHNVALKAKYAPFDSGKLKNLYLTGTFLANSKRVGLITATTGVITHMLEPWSRVDLGASYSTKIAERNVFFGLDVSNIFDERYHLGSGLFNKAPPTNYRVTARYTF